MKVGDLVHPHNRVFPYDGLQDEEPSGIVLKMNVNMWGEETIPSGVLVLWSGDYEDISVVYEDELEVISESR